MLEYRSIRPRLAPLAVAATLVCGAATVAVAQETGHESARGRERVTRVFKLQHADPRDVAQVINVFGGSVTPQPDLGVIVWSGPSEVLPGVDAAVAGLDVPPPPTRNLELTVHLLAALPSTSGAATLPDDLAGVATQLRKVMAIPAVRLVDTAVLRLRERSRNKSLAAVLHADSRTEAAYRLSLRKVELAGEGDDLTFRLDGLQFTVTVPVAPPAGSDGKANAIREVGLDTDIDLRPGQKVVVGKVSAGELSDALILVITGKVVD